MKKSPLIEQYLSLKEENKDSILFFRLGDFYEMFMDDAIEVSSLLNLTLTARVETPMCGIPYHAASTYIKRLLDYGKKIAICEQIGSPNGSLMQRKVVRVITPGAVFDEDFLDESSPNYILSYYSENGEYYTCRGDISTGRYIVRKFDDFDSLLAFISFCRIKEIVVSDDDYFTDKDKRARLDEKGAVINKFPHSSFTTRFGINIFKEALGTITVSFSELDQTSPLWGAVGGLFDYFKLLNLLPSLHISSLTVESEKDTLLLDENALRSLEIVKTSKDRNNTQSLFGTLNYTSTAMGQRALKERVMSPLRDVKKIEERLDWVEYFINEEKERTRIKSLLTSVYDIERMSIFIMNGSVKKYQLLRLSKSLSAVGNILNGNKDTPYASLFKNIDINGINEVLLLGKEIDETVDDDIASKRLMKSGVNNALDEKRRFKEHGDEIVTEYIQKLKAETGIQNLKLGTSKVFGFTLDVTPSFVSKVPEEWQEVQTLVNSHRYITPYLKDLEKEKDRSEYEEEKLDASLFNALVLKVIKKAIDILNIAEGIKEIDFFISLALAAINGKYTRPHFTKTGELRIQKGRHPIVEKFASKGQFIPNSIDINTTDRTFMLITGPNMAGKSTYLRQNALIIIMAQLGSFVSADSAIITPVDRIYSRLGFNDNIAGGESTFFVEMKETALILRNATKDSFIILDEIGRGTGSDDGMAIAESVMHYLAKKKIKTLFATHYISIASKKLENNIIKATLEVDEPKNGDVHFLRRVINGVASSSYGVHVASLAGVPEAVLFLARELLDKIKTSKEDLKDQGTYYDKGLFDDEPEYEDESGIKYREIKEMITSFDINSSTPLDAMRFIDELKSKVNT